ncbi:MAG: Crp/Fnr family transcriptional regulator, partial [Spirochaetaceae bacterium]
LTRIKSRGFSMSMNNQASKVPLFEGLPHRSLVRLERIQRSRVIPKGQILFTEGSEGDAVFILDSGAIKLFRTSEEGRETVVHVVRPGELFAEVVLFGRPDYPVSAEAVAVSRVRSLSVEGLRTLLDEEQFRLDFFANIMDKLRLLADRIHILTSCDLTERLLRFLEGRYGRDDGYDVDLPKKDVAAAIGTTPETLSRLITELSQQGMMSWRGRKLTLSPEIWER